MSRGIGQHFTAGKPGRRWLKRLAVLVAIFLVVGFAASQVVGHYSRALAETAIARVLPKLEKRTGLHITIGEIEPGLTGHSQLRDVSVSTSIDGIPHVLARIPYIEVLHRIKLLDRKLELDGVRLHKPAFAVELYPDGGTNLPAFFDHLSGPEREGGETQGFLRLLGDESQLKVFVSDGGFELRDLGRLTAAGAPLITLNAINGEAIVDLTAKNITLKGDAGQDKSPGQLTIEAVIDGDKQQVTMRLNNYRLGDLANLAPNALKANRDATINGRLIVNRRNGEPRLRLDCDARLERLNLQHRRIAPEEIRGIRVGLKGPLDIDIKQQEIKTDELIVNLGAASFALVNTTMRAPAQGPFLLDLTAQARHVPLQAILDGLPQQLIPIIYGAKVAGELDLTAKLTVDMEKISRSQISFEGGVVGFEPLSIPPRCDVRAVKSPDYRHLVRKFNIRQETIVLGPGNSDFVPANAVGNYLRGAVLTCEDGSFFHHHGFLMNHVNESLRRNLQERRFVRGASTISMQLAKNLFLSEEKTLSRKLQEGMLTWWMERELNKDRMFEIYMNIIEWGPKIYGCGRASRYYFGCHPSKLEPLQAAWMASIISNPVRWSYMRNTGIAEGWRNNIAFIMGKMQMRGTITAEDYAAAEAVNFEVPFVGMKKPETSTEPAAPAPAPAE